MVSWFLAFSHHFALVKQVKFGVSCQFLDNPLEQWPEIWHGYISWPPSVLIKFWSWSVDFPDFVTISTSWKWSNAVLRGIFWRTHGRNGMKFVMLLVFYWCLCFGDLHRQPLWRLQRRRSLIMLGCIWAPQGTPHQMHNEGKPYYKLTNLLTINPFYHWNFTSK